MKEKIKKTLKDKKLYKRLAIFILVLCVLFNTVYYSFIRPNCVYAAAVVAPVAVAGETILGLIISGMAAAGIYSDVKTKSEIKAMTEAEQKEYYSSLTVSHRELMKKLYDEGYFEGTEIQELVYASLYEVDGTSALDRYIQKQKEQEKEGKVLKFSGNPNGQKRPDLFDNAAISAGIIASWGTICDIGKNIKTALDKAVQKKMEEAAAIPDFGDWPAKYLTLSHKDPYVIVSTDVEGETKYFFLCHVYQGNLRWTTLFHGFSTPSDNRVYFKICVDEACHTEIYEFDNNSGTWVEPFTLKIQENHSYRYLFNYSPFKVLYFSGIIRVFEPDLDYFLRDSNPYPAWTTNGEDGADEGADPNQMLQELLNQYQMGYSAGLADAINTSSNSSATAPSNTIIIHDDPTVIEKYITVPASEPLVNPETNPDSDPNAKPVIDESLGNLTNSIPDNNKENLPNIDPEDAEDIKNEDPFYRNEDYVVNGLEDVFPFCIPWDIYRCIKILSATGEAPCWEFPFHIPSIGVYETIRIDLKKFDSIALICRWCETLFFIYALASKTKQFMFS